jgi:hypothetical protein
VEEEVQNLRQGKDKTQTNKDRKQIYRQYSRGGKKKMDEDFWEMRKKVEMG